MYKLIISKDLLDIGYTNKWKNFLKDLNSSKMEDKWIWSGEKRMEDLEVFLDGDEPIIKWFTPFPNREIAKKQVTEQINQYATTSCSPVVWTVRAFGERVLKWNIKKTEWFFYNHVEGHEKRIF